VKTALVGARHVAELSMLGERAVIDAGSARELAYLTSVAIDAFSHCVRQRTSQRKG
jgi:hypothetical protein